MTQLFRRSRPSAVGSGLALLLTLALAGRAAAATFSVTSLADAGPGSLRQAVLDANAAPGADTIVFTVNGAITLISGEIAITDALSINGPGTGALTVSGNDQSRIFDVDDGFTDPLDVLISGLTLTHGHAQGPGGAVVSFENLTIRDCVISDSVSEGTDALDPARGGNVASLNGSLRIENSRLIGGVAADGPGDDRGGNVSGIVVIENSVISGGSADYGGGISGTGRIHASTIAGNSARIDGGGIGNGFFNIDSSTISNNTAQGNGGGIIVSFLTDVILNSTVSGNRAEGWGGGIFLQGGGAGAPSATLDMRLSTFSNNTAGQSGGNLGFFPGGALISVDHSIIANGAPNDVSEGDLAADYSLIENVASLIVLGSHNLPGVDPLLGPLANNGGPTLTHALLPGSPAIDAGDPAIPNPPPTDQRGFGRIFGPAIDMGAFEAQPLAGVDVPALSPQGILFLSLLLIATGLWRLRLARRAG